MPQTWPGGAWRWRSGTRNKASLEKGKGIGAPAARQLRRQSYPRPDQVGPKCKMGKRLAELDEFEHAVRSVPEPLQAFFTDHFDMLLQFPAPCPQSQRAPVVQSPHLATFQQSQECRSNSLLSARPDSPLQVDAKPGPCIKACIRAGTRCLMT